MSDAVVGTTDIALEDYELMAEAFTKIGDARKRRELAIMLRNGLFNAYGSEIATIAIGEEYLKEYDRKYVHGKISETEDYMRRNPHATELDVSVEFCNPISLTYAQFRERGQAEAWGMAIEVLLYNFALWQERVATLQMYGVDPNLKWPYDEQQASSEEEPRRVHGLQPNAAEDFEVPSFLQTELAEKMLKAVEGVRGNKGVEVLNRGVTPWEFSTYADFGEIAQQITGQLGVRMAWGAWAKLVGVNPRTLKMQYIKAKNGRKKPPLSWKRIANAIKAVK